MHVNRTALLDGDIIAYQSAAWAHARGMDGIELKDRVLAQAKEWIEGAFCGSALACFSCPRDKNFRRDHWPDYKAHRDGFEDPPQREAAIAYLKEAYPFAVFPRIEADDIMGILGSRETLKDGSVPVIVTVDKDLRQVPGWHFNPTKEDFPVRVTPQEADFYFHQQWLTGDPTDNFPGLWKWGPVKAEKWLRGASGGDLTLRVAEAYAMHWDKAPASAGFVPMAYREAMRRCARVLRNGEWDFTKQVPIG